MQSTTVVVALPGTTQTVPDRVSTGPPKNIKMEPHSVCVSTRECESRTLVKSLSVTELFPDYSAVRTSLKDSLSLIEL